MEGSKREKERGRKYRGREGGDGRGEGLTSSDLQELKPLHSKLLHLSYQQDQIHF